jgi:hypothetical protein
LATPFVKRSCFEPSFLTPLNDQHSDEPKTYYNSHYNDNNNVKCGYEPSYGSNKINPIKWYPFDNRNSLWHRENSVIVGLAPRDYKTPRGETCPQQPYYVVDETGQQKVVCPILTSHNVQPQCKTCLTTVFQCERLKEIDPVAYQKCREYQRMIHYDIVTPNGDFIPMAVEMDGPGFDVYRTASQRCGVQCSSCAVHYPSMDYRYPVCWGSPYH